MTLDRDAQAILDAADNALRPYLLRLARGDDQDEVLFSADLAGAGGILRRHLRETEQETARPMNDAIRDQFHRDQARRSKVAILPVAADQHKGDTR